MYMESRKIEPIYREEMESGSREWTGRHSRERKE